MPLIFGNPISTLGPKPSTPGFSVISEAVVLSMRHCHGASFQYISVIIVGQVLGGWGHFGAFENERWKCPGVYTYCSRGLGFGSGHSITLNPSHRLDPDGFFPVPSLEISTCNS